MDVTNDQADSSFKSESEYTTEAESKTSPTLILATATVPLSGRKRKWARTFTERQARLSTRFSDMIPRSQYIISGYKTPQTESLFYATAVAYANECWSNKTDVKNFNKRPVAQKKIVDKLIKGIAVLEPAFETEFLYMNEIAVPGDYFKGAVVYGGYNNYWKYGDILGAILDVNIHVMENTIVPNRMVQFSGGYNSGRFSMVSVYDSYVRENRPHLFLFNDTETKTFHAITCVDNFMHYTFGYFGFCRQCFWTTFLTKTHSKKCKVLDAYKQYCTQRQRTFWTSSKKDWRPHPDNIQGRVEEVFGVDAADAFDWSTLIEEASAQGLLISKDIITVDDDIDEHVCDSLYCCDDEHLDCDHDRNAFEYADL